MKSSPSNLYSQQVVTEIAHLQGREPAELTLQIQYGKNGRIILGELASGEQRDEITEDRANLILTALKCPVDVGTNPQSYVDKRPMLEIRSEHETLFRQERDGTVSVNQFQWTHNIQYAATAEPPTPTSQLLQTLDETEAAQRIAQAARALLNPLEQREPATINAAIGEYHLHQDGEHLTVSHNGSVVVQVENGGVHATSTIAADDLLTFAGWVKNGEGIWEEQQVPLNEMSHFIWQSQTPHADPPVAAPAFDVAQEQVAKMPDSNSKAFFQTLLTDLRSRATQAIHQDSLKEAQHTIVEGTKTLYQSIRQGLESDTFKTFHKQTTEAVQEGTVKAVEFTGHGLERAGQWLASRPEAIREQRAARAVHHWFEQGFARTQEHSYELNGLKVSFQGRNQFVLSDTTTGQELLQFRAEKALFGDTKFTILSKAAAGISRDQYQAIAQVQQVEIRGSQVAEVRHAEKSTAFAAAARMVAEFHESNDYEGKHYRIQVKQDELTITAKDGRGTIYQQQGDLVESRLEQQDFRRFAQSIQHFEQQQGPSTQDRHPEQLEIG